MKFIITILFCFISVFGFGQLYPSPGTSNGSPTTKVTTKGGFFVDSAMGIPKYTDTAAANLTRARLYWGSIIITADNKTWIRNFTATKWLQFSTAGSSTFPVDSVTSSKGVLFCQDILSYWSGGVATAFDTIQIYDGIVKAGSITETSPNHFLVTSFIYKIGCVTYTSPDTTLITNGYDTLPRYYTIFGNTQNQAGLIVGEESENPTAPAVTPNQQILFGTILELSTGDSIIPIPPTPDIWAGRFRDDTMYGKWTYTNDTMWYKHIPTSDPLFTVPSPVIAFQTQALDTVSARKISLNQIKYLLI